MKNGRRLMSLFLAALLILGCVSITATAASNDRTDDLALSDYVVETTYGQMRGVEHEGEYAGITEYRGIPYAAAPVGELRFADPEDPEPWDGVYDADTYAPIVRQNGSDTESEPWKSDFYPEGTPDQDEDGLYLNVITSYTGDDDDLADRPVFIWFHGGALTHGYSYEPEFNGEELAKKGVVVVTVGHRLNIFGYLTLPQLSDEQGGSSGNYGLKDQFKALDWVWDNIEQFGGDRDNITLGGQSGGTGKSLAMAVSPYNDGRIKNIITQSGIPHSTTWARYDEAGYEYYQGYIESLGLDPDDPDIVDQLRAMDADDLLSEGPRGGTYMDDDYLPYASVREAIADGALDGINILGGSNLGETGGWDTIEDAEDFYAYYKDLFGDLYDEYNFEDAIQVTDATATDTAREIASYLNIMNFRMYGDYYKNATGADVYVYVFSRFTPSLPEEAGTYRDQNNLWAWHSSELWYTFASLREGVPAIRPWEDYDFELADTMSTYWSNFMKTGDPNGEDLVTWPSSADNFGYIELGKNEEIIGYTGLTALEEIMARYVAETIDVPMPDTVAFNASATEGGTVDAVTSVKAGSDARINVRADEGYKLAAVLVDGVTADLSDMDGDVFIVENVETETELRALFIPDQEEDFAAKYDDVDEDAWYYEAVDMLTGLGIAEGDGTSFNPGDEITRAEFTKLMYELATVLGVETEEIDAVSFGDVDGHWAMGHIGWAQDTELVNGYDDETFGPDDDMLRQDMAVFMQRFFEEQRGYDLPGENSKDFSDADEIGDYAEESVEYVVRTGLMQGHANGEFGPEETAQRSHVAQVMYNYLFF